MSSSALSLGLLKPLRYGPARLFRGLITWISVCFFGFSANDFV